MHSAVNRVCMRVAASVHAMRDTPVCHHVNAVHTVKMLIELACPLQGCLALAEGLMNVLPYLVIDEGGHNVRDSGLQCIQALVDLQVRSHGLLSVFSLLVSRSDPLFSYSRSLSTMLAILDRHVQFVGLRWEDTSRGARCKLTVRGNGVQPVTHLGVAPLFRDMVCLLALRLQGHFGGLVQHSAAAVAALSSILDRLHRDQELDWLDVIIQELLQARPPFPLPSPPSLQHIRFSCLNPQTHTLMYSSYNQPFWPFSFALGIVCH